MGIRPWERPLTGPESLTKSEGRVLELVAELKDNEEMTKELFVSQNTLRTHLKHLYQKLEVPGKMYSKRIQLIRIAQELLKE